MGFGDLEGVRYSKLRRESRDAVRMSRKLLGRLKEYTSGSCELVVLDGCAEDERVADPMEWD